MGFIGFSLGVKAAVYVAAFAPEFKAVVALDLHIAVNGRTTGTTRGMSTGRGRLPTSRRPSAPC